MKTKTKTILALIPMFISVVWLATVFVMQIQQEIWNWKFYASFLAFLGFTALFLTFLFLAIGRGKIQDKYPQVLVDRLYLLHLKIYIEALKFQEYETEKLR